MRLSHTGQNAYSRSYNRLEFLHLIRLGNTGLEDSQSVLLVHFPDRKRYTDLRIITSGRTDDIKLIMQQLIQKLFYNGFPVASRNTDHRNLKTLAMINRQFLQRFQDILHQQEVGVCHRLKLRKHPAYYKITDPQLIQIGNIPMPVVRLCRQSKE